MREGLAAVLVCVAAGGCLSSPDQGDGDVDVDGGVVTEDAGPGELCGTLRALRDDFALEVLEGSRWAIEYGIVDDGAVELSVIAGQTYAFMTSHAQYRVAGGEVQVELFPDAFSDASLFTMWLRGDGSSIGMQLDGELLKLVVEDEDGTRIADSAAYEPSQVWWRLRGRDGRIEWDASHNGEDWDELGSAEWAEPLAQLQFGLELREADTSTMDIRSVNQRAQAEDHCPVSSFTDEFEDLERWWAFFEDGCVAEVGGGVSLSLSAAATCSLSSRERFDLRGGAVAVGLTGAGDCEPGAVLSVNRPDDYTSVACTLEDVARLTAFTVAGDGSSVEYDEASHRYLRMRHDLDQGAIVWESHASGGGEWEQFDVEQVPDAGLEAVEVRLTLTGAPSGDPVNSAVFDQLNLVP